MNKFLAAILLLATMIQSPLKDQEIEPLDVAIIDSGIGPADHLKNVRGMSWDMRGSREDKRIKSEHGTHIASIIAERVKRPIRLHSFRADIRCRRDQPCELDANAIGAAIQTAINMDMELIQISVGGDLGEKTITAIRRAAEKGIPVVLSAGNDGLRSKTADAAAGIKANVYVVGALDERGTRAPFTSWSRQPDVKLIMRPGVNVPARNSKGEIEYVTGTSFAAPIFAAELLEAMPRKPISRMAIKAE